MNTKWLEDFIILADCKKFTSAAQMRASSQAAFSRRIQQLEELLGQVLFNREKTPISLTPAGKKLYPIAIEMVEMSERCKNELETAEPLLSIASLNTLACGFLPSYLDKVNSMLEDKLAVSVDTSGKFSSSYQASLLSERFDCLLLYRSEEMNSMFDESTCDVISLAQDKLIWVCAPVFMAQLENSERIPYLAYAKRAQLSDFSHKMCRYIAERYSLRTHFEANISESIKTMAIYGHGVACLPLSCIREELASQRLLHIWPESEKNLDIVMIKLKANKSKKMAALLKGSTS